MLRGRPYHPSFDNPDRMGKRGHSQEVVSTFASWLPSQASDLAPLSRLR